MFYEQYYGNLFENWDKTNKFFEKYEYQTQEVENLRIL